MALFIGAAVILILTHLWGDSSLYVQQTSYREQWCLLPFDCTDYRMGLCKWRFLLLLAQSGVNSEHYIGLMYNGDALSHRLRIISNLAWGLGYCGMPHILIRFMAIKNEKELRKSSVIAIVWVVISLTLAVVIGVVGRSLPSSNSSWRNSRRTIYRICIHPDDSGNIYK